MSSCWHWIVGLEQGLCLKTPNTSTPKDADVQVKYERDLRNYYHMDFNMGLIASQISKQPQAV